MCMTFLGGNGKILLKDIKERERILIGRQIGSYKDVRSPLTPVANAASPRILMPLAYACPVM